MTGTSAALSPEIASELEKVTSIIAMARRMMTENRFVDLSALDGKVKALCESARAAPGEYRMAAAIALKELVEDLDRLEGELADQNSLLLGEEPTTDRQTAARAYAKAKDEL